MSESTPQDVVAGSTLSPEHVQSVSGGCTVTELIETISRLTEAYENLVDFTSHVIERVMN